MSIVGEASGCVASAMEQGMRFLSHGLAAAVAVDPTSQPVPLTPVPVDSAQQITPAVLVFLGAFAGISLAILLAAGVLRPRRDVDRQRLMSPMPLQAMFGNLLVAIFVYFVAAIAAALLLRATGHGDAFHADGDVPAGVLIVLNVVAPLAMAASLLVGLRLFVPGGLARIGITRRPRRSGIAQGVGYGIAALPITLFAANLTQAICQRLGIQMDTVHPLLKSMDNAGPLLQMLGAASAIIAAPLSEELFFRGHLQSIIRAIVAKLDRPRPGETDAVLVAAQTARVARWASASAIVVTSLLFASIHPAFERPAIFCLSLILGLAYERSGNLWTSLALHMTFNGFSTLVFLFTSHGGA